MQQIPDSAVQALEALKKAEMFIENGVEYGFIRLPEKPDPALDTLPQVKAAIEALTNEGAKPVDVAAVLKAAEQLIHNRFDTYTARNGKRVSIEGDDGEKCWIVSFEDMSDLENAIRSLSAEPVHTPDFAKSIAYVIKEESLGGAACGWKSCSGCLETSEGQLCGDYPYSDLFKAHVGFGCSDCGGLGVVWEYYSKSCIDEMQRELKTAEPAQREQWQPIETAPKDGTYVLLYCDYYGIGRCVWDDWRGVWRSDDPNHGIGFPQPTHWMPLPAAPTPEAGA